MRALAVVSTLICLMWPGLATGQEARVRTISLLPIDGVGAAPALAPLLPALVEASLESGEGYEVGPISPATGWMLGLKVSGRGPWNLTARATAESGVAARGRISIKKIPFNDRESLIRAVDTLAAQLHAAWNAGGEPAPLSRALSSSSAAVESYSRALIALHSPDASGAARLLDEALAADPSFVMAAVQRIRLDLTAGEQARARELAQRALRSGGAQNPALTADLLEIFRLLSGDDTAGAIQKAEEMVARAPHLVWGREAKALALGMGGRWKEALDEWKLFVGSDDVVHQVWLGRAMMATGDFKSAAETLGHARAAWPSNLILYTLQAESYARVRETESARGVVVAMRDYMVQHDLAAPTNELNPYLLLGSVDLLEGKFSSALKRFDEALELKSKSGAPFGPTVTLHQTIVEMRRDLVTTYDELTRRRQLDDIQKLLHQFRDSLPPAEQKRRQTELLRLEGLITLKRGDTIGSWKLVDQIKELSAQPGYTAYDEAFLSAATAMKEDDLAGALAHFERAAKARGIFVDLMDLGQAQMSVKKYDDARRSLEAIEKGLESYAPSEYTAGGVVIAAEKHDDLILADPHLAAMIPTYQYLRARMAFETGNGAESRKYFNRMLKYLKNPDEQFKGLVIEALDRGARPE